MYRSGGAVPSAVPPFSFYWYVSAFSVHLESCGYRSAASASSSGGGINARTDTYGLQTCTRTRTCTSSQVISGVTACCIIDLDETIDNTRICNTRRCKRSATTTITPSEGVVLDHTMAPARRGAQRKGQQANAPCTMWIGPKQPRHM